MLDFPLAHELIKFIQLRERARTNPEGCGDPRVDNYRYCNVRREDDKVTKQIKEWLTPHQGHELFIPNVIMARLFNNPDTLDNIGYLEEWDMERVVAITSAMKAQGQRVFNAAYIVSTNGRKMDKVEYLCTEVLPWAFRYGPNLGGAELQDICQNLLNLNGMGSFMSAQVVADLKMFDEWEGCTDYWSFVSPGPGSMRGLNRLRGLDAKAQKYNQRAFSMYIHPLRSIISSGTGLDLCAQNTQNCLCEFDKFMRLTTGEGRPKQKYKRAT